MLLRKAAIEDAAVISAIHVASWRDTYASILEQEFLAGPIVDNRLSYWTDRLSEPHADRQVLLAIDAPGPVGFICTLGPPDPSWGACVNNLHVVAEARGSGIGLALLQSAAEWVKVTYPNCGMHLWVFEANTRARRFYQRHGAQPVDRARSLIPSARGASIIRLHWSLPPCRR